MSPFALLQKAQVSGVLLTLQTDGTIKASGDEAILPRWIPIMREHKAALVLALSKKSCIDAIEHALAEGAIESDDAEVARIALDKAVDISLVQEWVQLLTQCRERNRSDFDQVKCAVSDGIRTPIRH